MSYYMIPYEEDILEHHGIKGQKWGIRRYQNEDGTLTRAGKLRYNYGGSNKKGRQLWYRDQYDQLKKDYDDQHANEKKDRLYKQNRLKYIKDNYEKLGGDSGASFEEDRKLYNAVKAAKIGAASIAGALVTVGTVSMTNVVISEAILADNNDKWSKEKKNPDYMFKNNNDYIYEEGKTIYRKSANKNETGSGYDSLYVNTNKKDAKLFNTFLGTQGMGSGKKEYMYKMEANKEIKGVPERKLLRMLYNYEQEEQNQRDAFPLLSANNPERYRSTAKKPVSDEEFESIWNGMPKEEKVKYNNKLVDFTNSFYLKNVISTSNYKKEQEKQANYIKKIAGSEGYNAIPDLMDRRHFGEDALIVLDPDTNLTTVSVKTKTIVNTIVDNLAINASTFNAMNKRYNEHAKGVNQ